MTEELSATRLLIGNAQMIGNILINNLLIFLHKKPWKSSTISIFQGFVIYRMPLT